MTRSQLLYSRHIRLNERAQQYRNSNFLIKIFVKSEILKKVSRFPIRSDGTAVGASVTLISVDEHQIELNIMLKK